MTGQPANTGNQNNDKDKQKQSNDNDCYHDSTNNTRKRTSMTMDVDENKQVIISTMGSNIMTLAVTSTVIKANIHFNDNDTHKHASKHKLQ